MTAPVLERTRWGAVVAAALGVVLVALDMTVVAVALPTIGADFGAGPSVTQWVLLAYMLPLVALSVPVGRWMDRAGPLPAFLVAVGGFGAASVLIAAAPNVGLLLAGRALQGVFGSLVGVVVMPIVAASVRPEARARAMSVVLTLIPLSGVAGPGLGGLLTAAFGWRAIFLINVPVVLAAVLVGVRTVPARMPDRAGLPLPGARLVREAAVLAVATAALLLALDRADSPGVLAAVLGAVALGAVVTWLRLPESGPARSLLARRRLALPLIALPLITSGAGAVNFVVPYFLAEVREAPPAVIGLAVLALPAGMAALSPIAGALADRFGNRPLALAGSVLAAGGLAGLLFTDATSTTFDLVWWLALVGVGHGLFAGPNAAEILAHTPPEAVGTSSGLSSLLRTLGFAVGPAVGALAWTATSGGVAGLVATAGVCAAAALGATALTVTAGTRLVSVPQR